MVFYYFSERYTSRPYFSVMINNRAALRVTICSLYEHYTNLQKGHKHFMIKCIPVVRKTFIVRRTRFFLLHAVFCHS